MNRLLTILATLSLAVFASGCVTVQPPIPLDQAYWAQKPGSVGVVIVKMPKPTANKAGAQGLLDMAINNAMADGLTKHLNSLSLKDFSEAGLVATTYFKKQGVLTKMIEEELDLTTLTKIKKPQKGFAGVDFSSLKAKYGVDHLVVLEVKSSGTIRNYYGFVPTGKPSGYFSCTGQLVDLSNNKLLWVARNNVQQLAIEEPWDQPAEGYPHITSAFYRALETGKTALVKDLMNMGPTTTK